MCDNQKAMWPHVSCAIRPGKRNHCVRLSLVNVHVVSMSASCCVVLKHCTLIDRILPASVMFHHWKCSGKFRRIVIDLHTSISQAPLVPENNRQHVAIPAFLFAATWSSRQHVSGTSPTEFKSLVCP